MTYNIIYKHWQTPELKALYPKYFETIDEATAYAETHRPRFWHVHKVTSTQEAKS